DTDGGSEVKSITQDYGTAVKAPEAPTKEGYTFTGWDKEVPATMPATNVTLKAQWKVNQYTITFDTDGGSAVASITQDYGTAVKAPEAPTKEGYTFTGWDKEVPATMPATNVTLKAQWKVNQYTITFDTDGGSEVKSITQDYGTAVKAPEAPTKEGYTFTGWDKEVPATMPATNVTIKAQWKVNQYTITFDTDGGSAVASITQDYGTVVTAPEAPVKEGHTFIGWDKDVPATMPAGDITLKAQWSINQYKVTFVDGDSVVMSVMLDYGSKIELPEPPTKEGHTFTGWSPEVDETLPAHDVTYSATYEVNYYTLTYYINETEVYSVEVAYGDTIEVYVPEMEEGMEFNGWDTEIPTTMPAHDVDIYGTSSAVSAIVNLVGSIEKGVDVYAVDGRFVQKVYSVEQFMRLPKGIYIIRGKKIANTF
ncbi:MAG: InlB B-repeat-containing protein, partial [Bacteroidaceae bacterium]|nr:InlB B-repeat-containing protein [Bacteroidaceae bacterium]